MWNQRASSSSGDATTLDRALEQSVDEKEELPDEEPEGVIIVPMDDEPEVCAANADEPLFASVAGATCDGVAAGTEACYADFEDDVAPASGDEEATTIDAEDGDFPMEDEELGQNLALVSLLQDLKSEEEVDHAVAQASAPQEERVRGIVQKFAAKRGFGFIAPVGGGQERYFAHWSEIRSNDAWPLLAVGAEVEFTPALSPEGRLVAASITSIGGDEVLSMEEVNRVFREVSSFTITGEVRWFSRAGYGFIVSDADISWPQFTPAGSQIYVSREDLVVAEGCSGFNLAEGMRVQFRVFKPPDKPVAAAEVTAVGGQALVCPTLPPNAPWRGSEPANLVKRGRTKKAAGPARGRLLASNMSLSGVALASAIKSAVQRSIHKMQPKRRRVTSKPGGAAATSAASQAEEVPPETEGGAAVSLIGVPCRFFAEGRCSKGLSCRFLHSEQPAQNTLGVVPAQPASKAVLATVPCKYFVQGRCIKGDLCEFSHDTSEVDPVPLDQKLALECSFFARGFCSRGASCQFAHGPEELFEISVLKLESASTA